MRHLTRFAISAVSIAVVSREPIFAQPTRGGFIARLGNDTVHVERFERDGNKITGTILQRTPTFRVIRWTMMFDASGNPARYESSGTDASGASLLNGIAGSRIARVRPRQHCADRVPQQPDGDAAPRRA
jgi:hypothetical protein